MDRKEPVVEVGILSGEQIRFILRAPYVCDRARCEGEQQVAASGGKICWNGREYEELLFTPGDAETACFELPDVTIGVNFHWERKESQRFPGILKLIAGENRLTAVNVVPVETYLASVISSEMSATASTELLKAHAVISRSWLLNILANGRNRAAVGPTTEPAVVASGRDDQRIVWYDHQAHSRFDVCADDHCQRYQGISRITHPNARQAVEETFGEVLTYDGCICDARFSKCCGGVTEEFRSCWEDREVPYLKAVQDRKSPGGLPDLTLEEEARKWIHAAPEAFCHTSDERVLAQVLNRFDRETTDFYRWKVEYDAEELSRIIRLRSGIDFGIITGLQPLERGRSGRLVRLRIIGSKRTMVVGKELEIRRVLSLSHLYSSAFTVDKKEDRFVLTGAGWGHGVGLCQIGAAVMGEQGYTYNEILLRYYAGATLEKCYER